MKRFKPGQEVVCITKGDWVGKVHKRRWFFWSRAEWRDFFGPKEGDVVTVVEYHASAPAIAVKEYPVTPDDKRAFYPEYYFEPLADISELHEHLNATKPFEI